MVYTYTTGGKLETRTWARTEGGSALVTIYGYDPNTGEITGIDYSDATPDVTFVYDRIGRQKTITDAVGSRTFAYNDALQLESETITGLYDKTLTRTYETNGVVGRNSGITLGAGYTVNYDYDTTGRFDSVAFDVSGNTGTATYTYVPDSDLLETLLSDSGQITTYVYEPNRNLKTSVENAFNTTVVSRYGYQYDELGRRTSVTNSGTAFSESAFNRFDYNDRSELTGSSRYLGTDVADVSQPVDSESRIYNYDPIGNRESALEGTESFSYAPNDLNQYDSVTDGGGIHSLAYDADGNLTEKDGFVYIYNGENRLVSVEPDSPVDGDTMVEFGYDYMGRRVQKTVYTYEADHWSQFTVHLFLYDGWNLIEELDDSQAVQKTYVWGLDLSQSLQGAGGVGGLLAVVDDSVIYLYSYDGNGNVGQVIDAADGFVDAYYEYDPSGNDIRAGGGYADQNAFRFSTKFFDSETELYYYGYRYYSPELGRWINIDPKGEEGGRNLYGFVDNSTVNNHDALGLDFIAVGIRKVYVDFNGFQHMSIHYFEESPHCTKEGTLFTIKNIPQNANHIDSYELLARKWYYQTIKIQHQMYYKPYYIDVDVNVSIIFNKPIFDRNIKKFKVIYSDAGYRSLSGNTSASSQWAIISNEANSYKYALHFPLPKKLNKSNWPNVKYNTHPFNPTNSNTFARHLVRSIGKGGSDGDAFWGWDVGVFFSWEIGADYPDTPSVRDLIPYPIRKTGIGPMGP